MAKQPKATAFSQKIKIEYVRADSLQNNKYNPNRMSDHEFELLCRSILSDGLTQPPIAQRDTKEIVDGEHRWTAAIVCEYLRKKGLPLDAKLLPRLREARAETLLAVEGFEVPVVFVQMTPEQMRIATLRHNRARGSESFDLTAALMRELEVMGAVDVAQEELMIDEIEMQRLLTSFSVTDALEGDLGWAGQETPSTPSAAQEQEEPLEEKLSTPDAEQLEDHYDREEKDTKEARDKGIYKLALSFTGAEAEIVRKALGTDRPASVLVGLCRKALGF